MPLCQRLKNRLGTVDARRAAEYIIWEEAGAMPGRPKQATVQ